MVIILMNIKCDNIWIRSIYTFATMLALISFNIYEAHLDWDVQGLLLPAYIQGCV